MQKREPIVFSLLGKHERVKKSGRSYGVGRYENVTVYGQVMPDGTVREVPLTKEQCKNLATRQRKRAVFLEERA